MSNLMIGWTTFSNKDDAHRIASALIECKLAACVNIEAPVTAYYNWKGELESGEEYKITVKFPKVNTEAIKTWIEENHPYDTPQWIAIEVDSASKKYAEWVMDSSDR
jgi:periplasmic divalent cation tolerance protein